MRQAYYAHCQAIYGTAVEERDHALIRLLGYEPVLFDESVTNAVDVVKRAGGNVMTAVFKPLVEASAVLFFRALPDGRIPAGVAAEIEYADQAEVPVIEIPASRFSRTMTVDETREYLREVGQR
jgi:hypothetical protein